MPDLPPGFVLDTPNSGPVYGPPPKAPAAPTPFQMEDQQIQRDNAARSALEFQQKQAEWQATHNPDGSKKPEAAGDGKPTEYQSKSGGFYERMLRSENAFGKVPEGSRDARTVIGQKFHEILPNVENSFNTNERQVADQAALDFIRASLRQESGAAINADEEIKQYRIFYPMPGDGPDVIAQKAIARKAAMEGMRISAGPLASQAEESFRKLVGNTGQTAEPDQRDTPAVVPGVAPPGAPPPGADGNPPEGPFSPSDPGFTPSQGTRTVDDNPALAAEYRQRLAAGQKASEIVPWLRSQGAQPATLMAAVKQIQYRDKNPGVPIDRYSVTSTKEVPISGFEQAVTDIGSGPAGAYAVGAGQFLSGNTLDNLSSDPERARLAQSVVQACNPNAYSAGEFSGGVLSGLTGEAGLARMGMGSGLVRGTVADTLAGGANGAGMADNGNRLGGAVEGGLAQGLGSLAGGAALKGAGRALTPTGGGLADLYAAGVRPTPGQRAGGILNRTEEKLQSIPLVGDAIHGARDAARDQFQIGAFNESLKEIGDALPKGMKPGTDPHRYAQESFAKIYDQARSGMKVVADEQLSSDIASLAPEVQTLGPQAQGKFKAIMANTIKGDLSGNAYKSAMSDLGKHIGRLRKSAIAEDQHLADVLEGVQGALDGSARRNSDPEAVKLLDAADAGYAKLVRIEDAARRRGGEPGTFSPTNLDAAVQNTSGGVRSKAYLRGDALMQDFATQGRSLGDYTPNSGTFDRAAMGVAAAGAGYVSPVAATVLGALGIAYAPGVRKVTTGAFAPSSGTRRAIASRLKKIERLTSAATGASALLGTTPSQ